MGTGREDPQAGVAWGPEPEPGSLPLLHQPSQASIPMQLSLCLWPWGPQVVRLRTRQRVIQACPGSTSHPLTLSPGDSRTWLAGEGTPKKGPLL